MAETVCTMCGLFRCKLYRLWWLHGSLVTSGQWSAEEASQSSTWRELQVVKLVLKLVKEKLANERVR